MWALPYGSSMAGSTGLTRAMGASWWTMGPTHLRRPTITRRRRGATGLVNAIQRSDAGTMFDESSFMYAHADNAGIYSRAVYTNGTEHKEAVLERLRKLQEQCDSGLLLYRSVGGATGAGLCERLLHDTLPRVIDFCILPFLESPNSILEPYNVVLGLGSRPSLSFVFGNDALGKMCQDQRHDGLRPTFRDINKLVARTISTIAKGLTCWTHSTWCPTPTCLSCHATMLRLAQEGGAEQEIKLMALCLLYRGRNMAIDEVRVAVERLKSDSRLTWADGSNKFACSVLDQDHETSCVAVANSSLFVSYLTKLLAKFKFLWNPRAYTSRIVGEGMSSREINEALYNVEQLVENYSSCDPPKPWPRR
ncbi:Tubulin/FtsZ family, GTPase domain containing protein [Acanthamoeba castellanii str. Neff]|uniref:Tubulin/FtsZ family, GTPase domain containing protein n=1 Tax=Acanthamoeba castellanii (strain ATCC 30010 / Neff) TaxID=1257118 RepID=L8GW89_ACACF|nr:Tubulin/FtsZ family, GTPase domain containing protein [Acanthamoeba castellanii str. Neff]ELR16361.1 Tubulin/FtsZ family, GTPase domain containing protein [Acanthamoeba castellanii str. Neff]